MSSPAVTAKLETDVREAAAVMNDRRIKRLPVIDQENRLIGIISRADIVRLIGKK
jgi:CBS domain-containing protein